MIYFISPKITNNKTEDKMNFCRSVQKVIENMILEDIQVIDNITRLKHITFTNNDTVIFFNRNDPYYNTDFIQKLEYSKAQNSKIIPIAMTKSERNPPSPVLSKGQSYDVENEKRARSLTDNDISILGECFGRKLVIANATTLYNEKMKCFISHKRLDGEEIAYHFAENLNKSTEDGFIDLAKIPEGEDAQRIIEEELPKSDILILLQTPKSIKSYYLLKEIKLALKSGVPILWVLVGNTNKYDLKINPVGTPHFIIPEIELVDDKIPPKKVSEIINYGFEMVKLKKERLLDEILNLLDVFENCGYKKENLEKKMLTYQITKSQEIDFYKHRDICYLLNFLGRSYIDSDLVHLKEILAKNELLSKSGKGNHYDSTIIVSPQVKKLEVLEEDIFCDSYKGVEKKFFNTKSIESRKLGGIILSGAFPDYSDLAQQQNLIDAIHTLVDEIHRNKGTVIFGSHPTFQGLILEKGKEDRPDDYKEATKIYVSKWFEGKYDLNYFKENSIVIETNKKLSIGESLTEMRIKMIKDENAKALICLGGQFKTEDKPNPGIDEEIKIAKEQGHEVFLIGSVGGRSNQIKSEMDSKNFENLNTLSKESQIEIFNSLNYKKSFNTIIEHLKGEK